VSHLSLGELLGTHAFTNQIVDALNPFNWSSGTYLVVIVALLLLRVLVT